MKLKEVAKDAMKKVRTIFRKEKKTITEETAGSAAAEMIHEAGKLEHAVIGYDPAAGEDGTAIITPEEAIKALAQAGDPWEAVGKSLKDFADAIVEGLRPIVEIMNQTGLEKWKIAKMEMPNNERRRKGLPMIRRRGHIRAEKLQRRTRRALQKFQILSSL